MKNIEFRQKAALLLPYFILFSMMLSPGIFGSMMILYLYFQKKDNGRNLHSLCYIVIAALIVDVIGIIVGGANAVWAAAPISIGSWLFGFSPWRMMIPLLTELMLIYTGGATADNILLNQSEMRQTELFTHTSNINFRNRSHCCVAGTTGAGKTTYLLQLVEDSIKHDEDLYILSGKNGTDDPRSLLNVTKKLAKNRGRPFYVVSLNEREASRLPYNPFAEMSPTELADAFVCISEFTEPHYKACTSTWIKALCECLNLAGIPLSLTSVCDFYSFDTFTQLVGKLAAAGKISKEKQREYCSLKNIAEEASLSKSRYINLLYGDGSSLFGDGNTYINASKVRREVGIFFVDLDSFRYNDFTQVIGKLFINDIRHLIATERRMDWPKRIILDELGAYATEQLMPIFSQARSFGYQIVVATQSIADLSAVSESFAERVLENCGQYAVFRLNSAQDAETMANIVGTREIVETTHKSSGAYLDAGGAGTKKIVHEYKVSPDLIKELPPLQAILYDKEDIGHVKLLKVPFVDL